MTLDPSSNLSILGQINIDINISVNLGLFGASLSANGFIPLNSPNLPLTSSTAVIDTVPTGGAQLALWNEQVPSNLGDPGGDGGHPNPNAQLPSRLSNADLTGFNATLIGPGGAGVTTDPITINGNGGTLYFNTILGNIPLSLDATIVGAANANLHDVAFTQTAPGDMLVGTGGLISPLNLNNMSRSYTLNVGTDTTNVTGTGTFGINGTASLSIGGFINQSFPLNNLLAQSQSFSTGFPMPGSVKLHDMNPLHYNGVGDDMQATISANLEGLPLNLGLSSSGTAVIGSTVSAETDLIGIPVTITATIYGTITYGIAASVLANNIAYQFQQTVLGVVVPEPGSVVLLFVGIVGVLPLLLRGLRRRA